MTLGENSRAVGLPRTPSATSARLDQIMSCQNHAEASDRFENVFGRHFLFAFIESTARDSHGSIFEFLQQRRDLCDILVHPSLHSCAGIRCDRLDAYGNHRDCDAGPRCRRCSPSETISMPLIARTEIPLALGRSDVLLRVT
jgi:hypothetical protein